MMYPMISRPEDAIGEPRPMSADAWEPNSMGRGWGIVIPRLRSRSNSVGKFLSHGLCISVKNPSGLSILSSPSYNQNKTRFHQENDDSAFLSSTYDDCLPMLGEDWQCVAHKMPGDRTTK